MSITIDPAVPHEAILAANEAKGLSENDRKRIIAAAEQQVTQHSTRVLDRTNSEADRWTAEAEEAHDALAQAEVEVDRLTKQARDGQMTTAEFQEALEKVYTEERRALRALDRATKAQERIARVAADPYAEHMRMVSKFPALRGGTKAGPTL